MPDFHLEAYMGMEYSLLSDLAVHGGCYAIAVTILLCFYRRTRSMLLAAGVILIFSFLLEFLQWWVPGRTSSLFDALCNGIGITSAILLHLTFRKIKTS